MGVKPRQLKLSDAKRRWGSCSAKQSINLNWRLIMLDDSLIDYVVVHELAHLLELNHSADFWRIVESVLPDHRDLTQKVARAFAFSARLGSRGKSDRRSAAGDADCTYGSERV